MRDIDCSSTDRDGSLSNGCGSVLTSSLVVTYFEHR